MRARHAIAAPALVALLALLAAGCGGSARPHRAATLSGCGGTSVRRGGLPAWTAPAFADSGGPGPIPYSVSDGGNAVAYQFAYPLRAGHPTDPSNKVLWIMRLPRQGTPLRISAAPIGRAGPTVHASWPADASPGEIYPSYVDVPTAGCWRLTLRWARHVDRIDLRVRA